MNLIGLSVKQIRISKGLTQSYISDYCQISQSNYAKFEKGIIDIRASTFISILDSMDIPYHEFMYIHNKYNLSKKDAILYKFFNIPFNGIEELNN
ncbi:helix-turn-helix domain-containing protein [Metasolibacillus meyeri]|uniref:helix-turn-helix domain-containing protein n=1 Tax=Metasolibacillus meyeri TaxID=1071052 RepID=UPI00187D4D80|nr:helix-turn-helix transcriptional regulator [Metasolibacillus meyeri]